MIAVMQFFGKAPFVSNFRKETLVQTIKDAGFEIIESRTFEKSPNSRYLVAQKR